MNADIAVTQRLDSEIDERSNNVSCIKMLRMGNETDASARGEYRLVSSHDLDSSDIDASMIV